MDFPTVTELYTASDTRLLSLSRIYVSLYRDASVNNPGGEQLTRKTIAQQADHLFSVLRQRIDNTPHCMQTSRLIMALYHLAEGTSLTHAPSKMEICHTATTNLIKRVEAIPQPDELTIAGLCRCLSEYFYPEAIDNDPWFLFFRKTIETWANSLSATGSWSTLTHDQALERIEVMNRNSYMFLDHRFDPKIRQAYQYYSQQIRLETDTQPPPDDKTLHLLGLLSEAAMQGNAYPVDHSTAFLSDASLPEYNSRW